MKKIKFTKEQNDRLLEFSKKMNVTGIVIDNLYEEEKIRFEKDHSQGINTMPLPNKYEEEEYGTE